MSYRISPTRMPAFTALALVVAAPVNSWAATSPPDEIVVTARKREESLQDVPISITAFTAEKLRESGAVNNYDVALLTVNFNTLQQNGRRQDRPVVRGQAAPANRGEPNASYFIDGAYVSGSISTATLGPVERVEILRGPQSAQFGRATFAGAVNYVTRKPSNEWTGEIQTRAGTDDTYLLSGWTSGPLIEDKLLFFGAASWDKVGGGEFHNNLEAGEAKDVNKFIDPNQSGDYSRLNTTTTKEVLGKLLWQIDDTSELTLKASFAEGDDGHYAQLIMEQEELNCYPDENDLYQAYCGVMDMEKIRTRDKSDPLNGKPRENRLNLPDIRSGMTHALFDDGLVAPENLSALVSDGNRVGTRRDQYRLLADYRKDIGDWQMAVRGALNDDELEQGFDLDHKEDRPFTGLFAIYQEQSIRDQSLEIRFDSPGDRRLRGTIGAYYFKSDWKSRQQHNVGPAAGNLSPPTRQETTNTAIFGSLDYDFNDRWTFSSEVRVARDKKSISSENRCLPDAGDPPDATANPNWKPEFVKYIDPEATILHKIAANSLTPRFTLRYQATDNAMFYLQAAKGNKPADFNTPYYHHNREGCQTQVAFHETGEATVDEEKAWTYEVGAKTSWLDNRITANLAVFYINWKNQGVFQVAPISLYVEELLVPGFEFFAYTSIGDTIIENAGKSEVYGLEFESSYFITDNFQMNFAYGLTVGEYKEYNDPFFAEKTGKDGNTDPGLYPDGNVAGHTIPDSPKHSFVLGANYARSLSGDMDWFVRSDVVHETERYAGADNFIQIDERTFWNARTGLQTDTWEINGYVNNILDEHSAASILRFVNFDVPGAPNIFPAAYAASPLPGKNWGVELLFRFGQ